MDYQSICDHIAVGKPTSLWGREQVPCTRPALVRVFFGHDANLEPIYRSRCLGHAAPNLGPEVIAYWDDGWAPTRVGFEGSFYPQE